MGEDTGEGGVMSKCVVCGCVGNQRNKENKPCGFNAEDCSLDRAGVCPCCNKAGKHCIGCFRFKGRSK